MTKLDKSCWVLLVVGLLGTGAASGQEMPKGFIMPVELGQGFHHLPGGPDLYLGTLQLAPQWTIVPGHLRAGLVLGLFYPGTPAGALAGGRVTYKIYQGPPVLLASSFHVHVLSEYLPAVWTRDGTWRQWVGGGVGIETGNWIGIALKVHRDFGSPATYGQLAITYNLCPPPPPPPL